MSNRIETTIGKRGVRGLTALLMLVSLIAIPITAVQAAEPPSSAPTDPIAGAPVLRAETGALAFTCDKPLCDHAHITAYIEDAPAKAWISVQWLDGVGAWHNVEGWQGNIDTTAGTKQPFKQWAVLHNQLGQGPFRWVVYNELGGTVWGVSPNFNLPKNGGLDNMMFLTKRPVPVPVKEVAQEDLAAQFTEARQLKAEKTTYPFTCSGLCDHGHITTYIKDAPANAWVAVQWQDVAGVWRTVTGWQGSLSTTKGTNEQFQQWAVFNNALNKGPFRWVVYTERGGSVWGVSPSFTMPKNGGLDFIMFLSN